MFTSYNYYISHGRSWLQNKYFEILKLLLLWKLMFRNHLPIWQIFIPSLSKKEIFDYNRFPTGYWGVLLYIKLNHTHSISVQFHYLRSIILPLPRTFPLKNAWPPLCIVFVKRPCMHTPIVLVYSIRNYHFVRTNFKYEIVWILYTTRQIFKYLWTPPPNCRYYSWLLIKFAFSFIRSLVEKSSYSTLLIRHAR